MKVDLCRNKMMVRRLKEKVTKGKIDHCRVCVRREKGKWNGQLSVLSVLVGFNEDVHLS